MVIGWHCFLNLYCPEQGWKVRTTGSPTMRRCRYWYIPIVWFFNFWCKNNLHFSGGECGPSSFKSCHPVWRLWWRRRGYVKVLKPDHFDWDSLGYHSLRRPFGVAILFAGMDDNGTQLYHMDPSGTYLQVWLATEMVLSCWPHLWWDFDWLWRLPSSLTQRRSGLEVREPNRVCKRFESFEIIFPKISLLATFY